MRPPMRLAALMKQHVIYVFTHDSVGVGEDGPTHQPIEQLAGLRAVPNLIVIRPADANEVTEAWRVAVAREGSPVALVLTRQGLPIVDRETHGAASGLARGAYVLADAANGTDPRVILIATGSEVSVVLEARELLEGEGIATRVVSMPSWDLFEEQDAAYRDEVLPPGVTARVAVEAASPFGWERYVDRCRRCGATATRRAAPGRPSRRPTPRAARSARSPTPTRPRGSRRTRGPPPAGTPRPSPAARPRPGRSSRSSRPRPG
jgi:transketolase